MGDKPGRFEEPDPATMSAEQREIYDRLLDGRGKLPGPYRVWLENPAFSEATERLSQQVRFASDIPNRLKELAIIVTVRHWRAQYAWHSHAAAARTIHGQGAEQMGCNDPLPDPGGLLAPACPPAAGQERGNEPQPERAEEVERLERRAKIAHAAVPTKRSRTAMTE